MRSTQDPEIHDSWDSASHALTIIKCSQQQQETVIANCTKVCALYKGKSVAVVVPAFNEGRLAGETLDTVPRYVDRIYAVDDNSTDETLMIMLDRAAQDTRIAVIKHNVNRGVGASIVSGYKVALQDGIDVVAVMAGDCQMDPKHLPRLLDPIVENEAWYVKGNRLFNRELRSGMSSWRYFGNVVLTYLNKIASGYWDVVDPQNGYTAIKADALRVMDLDSLYPRYAFENDMLVKLNVHSIPVLNVPIPAKYGEEKSKISYVSFIVRTSAFFVRALCWRIWHKHIAKEGATFDGLRLPVSQPSEPSIAAANGGRAVLMMPQERNQGTEDGGMVQRTVEGKTSMEKRNGGIE